MAELQVAIARAAQHETAQGQGRRGVIPAPVMGWNSNDPEAAMEPIYAIHCENYFPERGRVASRRGSTDYATLPVSTNPVETLATVVNGATEKLYAFTSASVYDVSDPAAVTEAVSLGITEGRWRGATMNGHGIFVNGTDAPLTVDATNTWVAHGWTGTGLTASNLTQVAVHKRRLFFLEKDSANLWYGDLSAITGPLNKFNLGLVNAAGGNAMAVGSLSLDTGAGIDDLLVICMSRGHVLVYAGNDPSTISDWQLAGIFHLGAVIGDRPLIKLGGDLIAITADGYIPLLQFLRRRPGAAPARHIRQDRARRDRGCSAPRGAARMAADLALRGQLAAVQRAEWATELGPARPERPDGRMVLLYRHGCALLGDVSGLHLLRRCGWRDPDCEQRGH